MYDNQIGRWGVVDPKTDIYFSQSTYTYVANNPINLIDPTGMTIEDPDKIIEKQKQFLQTSKDEVKNMIDKGFIGSKIGKAIIEHLKGALNEIKELEKSDQNYKFVYNDEVRNTVGYDLKTKTVVTSIGTDKDSYYGVVGHEIKHSYQFEKGEISISVDNSGYGVLYDIGDETEAYNTEGMLSNPDLYVKNEDGYIKDDNWTRQKGANMVPPAYQNLRPGPININSPEGKELRNKTTIAGKEGREVTEVYIGWEKDYEKGKNKIN